MERPDYIGQLTNLIGHADLIFMVVASHRRDSSACGTDPRDFTALVFDFLLFILIDSHTYLPQYMYHYIY